MIFSEAKKRKKHTTAPNPQFSQRSPQQAQPYQCHCSKSNVTTLHPKFYSKSITEARAIIIIITSIHRMNRRGILIIIIMVGAEQAGCWMKHHGMHALACSHCIFWWLQMLWRFLDEADEAFVSSTIAVQSFHDCVSSKKSRHENWHSMMLYKSLYKKFIIDITRKTM